MMKRRTFIGSVAGGVLAAPLDSFAQPPGKVWRIGILDYGSAESDYWMAFRKRLGEIGYIEGRNLAIEARSASGNQATLASEAAELVKLKVDLIATRGTVRLWPTAGVDAIRPTGRCIAHSSHRS
jgi:putative tryptophan/tyrosine transport system substrate-binding protein